MKATLTFIIGLLALQFTLSAQINFAPVLGLNLANYHITETLGDKLNTQFRPGIRIGGLVDIKMGNNLHLQSGASYVENGYNFENSVYFKVNTIEIPVNFEIVRNNGLFVGGGAFLGINASGTIQYSNLQPQAIKIGRDATSSLVPLDAGFDLNIGYQFKNGAFLRAHYLQGLVNLKPNNHPGELTTDYSLGLTAGYFLFYRAIEKRKEVRKQINTGTKKQ